MKQKIQKTIEKILGFFIGPVRFLHDAKNNNVTAK